MTGVPENSGSDRAILALDLGTRTGWALLERGRVESGAQTFALGRGESPGMRYIRFGRWLQEIALDLNRTPRVTVIVYEQTHHRGGAATELAAGLATRVQEFGARYGIEHTAIHSATLKKFATGSGRADKAAMLAAARAAFGYVGADDNEADALWLLSYTRRELLGEPSGLGPPGHARGADSEHPR